MSVTCNDGIEIGNIAVAFWEAEVMAWNWLWGFKRAKKGEGKEESWERDAFVLCF